MDANVKKVFEESPWFLATCGDEPHVVPVGFKTITTEWWHYEYLGPGGHMHSNLNFSELTYAQISQFSWP